MGLGLVFGFPCEIKQNEIKFNLRDFYSEEEKSILIKFQVFENQKEIELTTKLNFTDSETLE